MKHLAEFIKVKMREFGLTQSSLANLIPISQQRISNFATGRRKPKHRDLQILADFFGVSCTYMTSLAYGVKAVPPDTDVLPILRIFDKNSNLTFSELEELILKPKKDKLLQLQEIRSRNKKFSLEAVMRNLSPEQRAVIEREFTQLRK